MPIVITSKMKQFIKRQKNLAFVTTSSNSGLPNIAPKVLIEANNNIITYADLIADRTAENIHDNNQVSIAVIDVASWTGFQFKGDANILTRGKTYEKAKNYFGDLKFNEPIHAVEIIVKEILYFEQGPEAIMEAA